MCLVDGKDGRFGMVREGSKMKRLSLNYFPFEEDEKKKLIVREYEAPDEGDEDEVITDETGALGPSDEYGTEEVVGSDGEKRTVIFVDVVWKEVADKDTMVKYAKALLKGVLRTWADEAERLEAIE